MFPSEIGAGLEAISLHYTSMWDAPFEPRWWLCLHSGAGQVNGLLIVQIITTFYFWGWTKYLFYCNKIYESYKLQPPKNYSKVKLTSF